MPGYKKDVSAMKTARKKTTTANIASTVRQKTKLSKMESKMKKAR